MKIRRKDVTRLAVDPTFAKNAFNKSKILNESETTVRNVLTLLLGRPGFYPSIPYLGMNISQYLYNFTDTIDTAKIKAKLAAQCSDFLDNITDGTFDVRISTYKDQPIFLFILPVIISDERSDLIIGIRINRVGQMVYNYVFNKEQYI